jgi:hypothetical protein
LEFASRVDRGRNAPGPATKPQFSELHWRVLPYGRMPCPYFRPVEPLVWASAPILPLGDAYAGSCRADAEGEADPPEGALIDFCNLGYARGRCAHFPEGNGPDAVRFAVKSDAEGTITVAWVRERDHHPFDQGVLEYSEATRAFAAADRGEMLLEQARAYVASYLRRIGKEPGA